MSEGKKRKSFSPEDKKLQLIFFPAVPKRLDGEIILITGGANGIGREICFEIARREKNLTVISWDVNEKNNVEIVRQLKDLGVKQAFAFTVDVSKRKEVEEAAIKVRNSIGDVTILINNAGVATPVREAWKMDPVIIEKTFGVNVFSHCWTLQAFLPGMIKRKKGHVVETCSVLGFVYGTGGSPYIASKHAIASYMLALKEDLRQLEDVTIHISIAYPFFTRTNFIANLELRTSYDFIHSVLTPTEVAKKVVNGMLRNEEHIYVPGRLWWLHMLTALCPPAVVRMGNDKFGIYPKTRPGCN